MSRKGVVKLIAVVAVFVAVGVGIYLRSTREMVSRDAGDPLAVARASGKVVVADFGRGIISSFSFGLLFGIISTPCAVPIIAVLMVLIATQGSILYAAVMLLVYSLGHCALLLVAGTSMGAAKKIIESRNLTRATNALRKVAAALIIAVGLYFLYR